MVQHKVNQKIINNSYIGQKIGRINATIAKSAHIKSADIYLSKSYLTHITNRHRQEIEKIGMSVFDYIQFIIKKYNQIRDAHKNALMLVVCSNKINHGAVIELLFATEKGIYITKSVHPFRIDDLEKYPLLWKKKLSRS